MKNTLKELEQINLKHFRLSNKETLDFSTDYDAKSETGQTFTLSRFTICGIDDNDLAAKIILYKKLKSPLILQFYGFNLKKKIFSILIEKTANGSLHQVIEFEKQGQIIPGWNNTKKLINIFGIASGMVYLHSQNIIHKFLKASHIYLDEHLFPKIKYICEMPGEEMINCSVARVYQERENFLYLSPELISSEIPDKSSDVYSFSIILLKILVKEYEFPLHEIFKIMGKIVHGERPKIISHIPRCYKELIEKCWSQKPEDRPTFNEIVSMIKNNKEFITEIGANEKEFNEYVEFIEGGCKNNHFQNFPKVKIDFEQYKKVIKKNFSLKIQQVNLSDYEKKEQIGKGSFGTVYKVIDKNTGGLFAVKISIKYVDECNDDEINSLTREIKIISQLQSPTIVKFIGYSINDFDNYVRPTIITEILPNGSLGSLLNNARKGFADNSWSETKKLINIYGIAFSIAYLHSLDIIHRDLKPENIFLDDYLYPKLGDFGLSKSLNEKLINEPATQQSYLKGTYSYMAPEIFESRCYSKASDVYAFSLIVYEIVSNERPFAGLNQFQLLIEISKCSRPEFNFPILNCYKELITRCWSENPEQRPTFDEIVHFLKTNKKFITNQVDENEFYDYIELIGDKIPDFKEEINTKSMNKVKKIELKSFKNSNDDKILYLSTLQDKFVCLSKYEKIKLIQKCGIYNIYEVKNKENGNIYAGKFSTIEIDQLTKDEIISLSREVNIISEIKHPSILKFIGYSPYNYKDQQKPVIITEFPSNMTLSKVLELEREGHQISSWNDTIKLIIIYGIASGMKYLHSNQILHRDLNTESIFLDDHLFPKIGNFSFLINDHTMETMTYKSTAQIKGNPNYSAPEVLTMNHYSKAGDVYSFALIVFEIVSNEVPFKNISNLMDLINDVGYGGNRPSFGKSVPFCYRDLIELCWDQNPEKRPSFEGITSLFINDKRFVANGVDKIIFMDYVESIESFKDKVDEYDNDQISLQNKKEDNHNENSKQSLDLHADDQANIQNKLIKIQEDNHNENPKQSLNLHDKNDKLNAEDQINTQSQLTKIQEDKDNHNENPKQSLDLHDENEKLNTEDQINTQNKLTKVQENNIKSLDFHDKQSMTFYIKEAEHGNIEAQEYLVKKYIIENDTEKIYLYCRMLIKSGNYRIPFDYARKLFNLKHYEQAFNYFSLISKSNHPIANYFIGIMKFHGFGCKINKDESYKILKYLSDNGIEKATEFLESHFTH